jgi:hypothetical protein
MTALSYVYNRFGLAEYHKREMCFPWTDRPAFIFWEPPILGPQPPHRSALYSWHDGRCGLCGFIERLVMDHDHRTGLERGLLCRSCNTSEGAGRYPLMDPWRDGVNTANYLGPPEVYVNAFGQTPMRLPSATSDADLDVIADAVTR